MSLLPKPGPGRDWHDRLPGSQGNRKLPLAGKVQQNAHPQNFTRHELQKKQWTPQRDGRRESPLWCQKKTLKPPSLSLETPAGRAPSTVPPVAEVVPRGQGTWVQKKPVRRHQQEELGQALRVRRLR